MLQLGLLWLGISIGLSTGLIMLLRRNRRTEAVLQQYQQIVSSTLDGVALVDRAYTYRLVNQTYLNHTQKQQTDIVGHTISEVMGETLFQSVVTQLDRCLAGETIRNEVWFDFPDHQRHSIGATYAPCVERDGTISGVVMTTRDLPAITQAETDLQASKAFLNQIINVISDTIFVKDEQYRFVLVNQAVCDLSGITQEAFLGRSDYDFFPKAQADHFREKDHHVFQTGLEAIVEEPLTSLTGETRWLLTKKVCFQNQQGQKFLVGSSRDITDRKATEVSLHQLSQQLEQQVQERTAAFQESRDLFEAIFQESADAIFLVDPVSLLTVDCNQRAVVMFEADRKEDLVGIRGHTMHKMPFSEAELSTACREFKQRGDWSQEIEYRTFKGRCFWGSLASKQIQISKRFMNLVRVTDTSDYKRVENERQRTEVDRQHAEAALRQSEARFQHLAAHIPGIFYQSLIRADGSRQFHYISSGFQRLFELEPAQLMANANLFWTLVHPDDLEALQAEVIRTLSTQEPFQFEYRIVSPSGRIRWLHNAASREYLENGDIVSDGVVLDITDRKQAEADLKASETSFRTLIEELQVGVIVYNLDLTPRLFNSKMLELTGATASELQNNALLDPRWNVIREDGTSLPTAEYPAVRAMMTRQPVMDEVLGLYRPLTQDRVWLLVTAEPQLDEYGEVKQVICTSNDISDRKRIEDERKLAGKALRQFAEREHLLRTITEQIHQSLDLDSILTLTVAEVRQMLQADRALIFHLTADSVGVVLKESVLPKYPVTASMLWDDECFPLECRSYYEQGLPRLVPDVATDVWASCLAEFMQACGVKSKVVAPIVLSIEDTLPQLWGILVVHSCTPDRQWELSEAELLQQIANQLAIAIQQANLYQQLKTELTERRQIELQLRTSLQEKEILLKEVHHRVKNNLQVISSMLWLQANAAQHEVVSNALIDTRHRLQAMALIHETFYQSTRLGQLKFDDYIQSLVNNLLAIHSTRSSPIQLTCHLQPTVLNLETAIPCGLLLNELITNAVKHAFPTQHSGEICITLEQRSCSEIAPTPQIAAGENPVLPAHTPAQEPTSYVLTVQDNGVGIPNDLDLDRLTSLGLKIAYDLALQLRGTLVLDRTNGTRFQLTFSVLDYRQRL